MKVPVTTSKLVDTPYRRVKSLVEEGLQEVPILGVSRSVRATEGAMFHRHRGMEITYCAQGNVKFDCGGRAYSIVPGGVFISRPEDVHRLRNNPKGAKLYWIFLNLPKRGERMLGLDAAESRWLARALRALPRKAFSAPLEVAGCYERLFRILDTEKPKSVARRMKLRAAILQLLIALTEAGALVTGGTRDVRLQALVDHMRREPKKAFSMDEAAAELRCSPNTVRAHFKKYTGLSPQSFMMKCRIHKAQDLLREGEKSVLEIALELGFSSSQNFAIRFRQEVGKSPTEWQRENG